MTTGVLDQDSKRKLAGAKKSFRSRYFSISIRERKAGREKLNSPVF
jgi:hypothetical protein